MSQIITQIHKKNLHNIYLIGPMGAGKTSVSKSLTTLTKSVFYDSDGEIERQTGIDIPWIFEKEGETGFRERESKMIESLCKLDNIILSTGGGTILTESNRRCLSKHGIVVYLMVSVEIQFKRIIQKRESRPLVIRYDSKEKLKQLNKEREPLYRSIANLVYSTNNLKPQQLATQILNDIKKIYKISL
ncbi:shikimate kinase [Coxiella endosymbiont of Amblyomma nuttalli]|uniref:shikimate kinase n=1 Tax=Coxiella endosymbiont of Amblyomma nuttalli TaxID=2749996 RepID=UPI001FD5F918|nr:shikimate kinase [Coxiella endosymbiont of Amblyomma nuttalli]